MTHKISGSDSMGWRKNSALQISRFDDPLLAGLYRGRIRGCAALRPGFVAGPRADQSSEFFKSFTEKCVVIRPNGF